MDAETALAWVLFGGILLALAITWATMPKGDR